MGCLVVPGAFGGGLAMGLLISVMLSETPQASIDRMK
jgi:hypothetical protein